jgi:hypothetical protein
VWTAAGCVSLPRGWSPLGTSSPVRSPSLSCSSSQAAVDVLAQPSSATTATSWPANPGTHNSLTHSFRAVGVEPVSKPNPEATEDLRVFTAPVDDVARLVFTGEVVQALHFAPLLKYLLTRIHCGQPSPGGCDEHGHDPATS